ncbi:MAG: lipoyl(octanoyl) transferase [Oleispira sp.]|jgi:lipoyl(octanoyl) transferase
MCKNGNVMTESAADLNTETDHEDSVLIVRNFYDQNLNKSLLDYQQIHEKMLHFTQNRCEDTVDEIWLLQHPKVFTQGQAGKAEHILFAGDIPVVQSDRGGQVTYHGPGQLVVYLMIDIKRKGWGPRQLVSAIEDAIVATLKDFDIDSAPKKEAPGVYVQQAIGDAKIASLGLRIKQGRSFHGLALNIDMDMEPFQRINPCGYVGMAMTQVKTELFTRKRLTEDIQKTLFENVSTQLKHHLTECLQYTNNIELPA